MAARPPAPPEDELEDPDALSTDYLINRMKRDLSTIQRRVVPPEEETETQALLRRAAGAYRANPAVAAALHDRCEAEADGWTVIPMEGTIWQTLRFRHGSYREVRDAVQALLKEAQG